MVISLGKLAPRVIVLAVVGYCVWPSVAEFAPSSNSKPSVKRSGAQALRLKPATSKPPTTNPWGGRDAATLAAAQKAAEASVAASTGKTSPSTAARIAPAQLLARLTLNATYIAGDRQLAVINGQVCEAGQTTRFLDSVGSETAPCKIVRVLPQKVVLDCGGTTLELTYPDGVPLASATAPKPNTFPSRPIDK
ncbi:MAG: hypothetical protein ABFC77_01940 [Thermoguttaceae bacterium]